MYRLVSIFIMTCMVFSLSISAFAASETEFNNGIASKLTYSEIISADSSTFLFHNNVKNIASKNIYKSLNRNNCLYVPIDYFTLYKGFTASYIKNVLTIVSKQKNLKLKFSINNKNYTRNNIKAALKNAPIIVNGMPYLPLTDILDTLKIKYIKYGTIVVISDKTFIDDELLIINAMMDKSANIGTVLQKYEDQSSIIPLYQSSIFGTAEDSENIYFGDNNSWIVVLNKTNFNTKIIKLKNIGAVTSPICVYNGSLYYFGRNDDLTAAGGWKYDLKTGIETKVLNTNYFDFVDHNGSLYIIGASPEFEVYKKIYKYNFTTKKADIVYDGNINNPFFMDNYVYDYKFMGDENSYRFNRINLFTGKLEKLNPYLIDQKYQMQSVAPCSKDTLLVFTGQAIWKYSVNTNEFSLVFSVKNIDNQAINSENYSLIGNKLIYRLLTYNSPTDITPSMYMIDLDNPIDNVQVEPFVTNEYQDSIVTYTKNYLLQYKDNKCMFYKLNGEFVYEYDMHYR